MRWPRVWPSLSETWFSESIAVSMVYMVEVSQDQHLYFWSASTSSMSRFRSEERQAIGSTKRILTITKSQKNRHKMLLTTMRIIQLRDRMVRVRIGTSLTGLIWPWYSFLRQWWAWVVLSLLPTASSLPRWRISIRGVYHAFFRWQFSTSVFCSISSSTSVFHRLSFSEHFSWSHASLFYPSVVFNKI